jgi:hypothetical protein
MQEFLATPEGVSALIIGVMLGGVVGLLLLLLFAVLLED